MSYYGWANFETWVMENYFTGCYDDGEYVYYEFLDIIEESSTIEELEENLYEYAEDKITSSHFMGEFIREFIWNSIEQVDFYEIAKAHFDDVERSNNT